ncbi:MAG: TolC family protein [Candidatus Omnitrophota bacterium]
MLRKRIRIGGLILGLCLALSVHAQEQLTLNQFVENALKTNESIQIALEAINGAQARVEESKSLYYPQISLAASYTRLGPIQEFNIPFGGQMMNLKFGLPNNYDFKLGAVEQIYNWGRTGNMIRMSKTNVDLARENVLQVKHVISYQLVPIFYGVVFTKDALSVLDDHLNLFRRRLSITQERYKAGLASDFDISLLQVQISAIEEQKIELLSNINKAMLTYNRIAARKSDATFNPAESLTYLPFNENKSDLLRDAFANREELKITGYQENLTHLQVELARAGNKPSVSAILNYEYRNGVLPDLNKIRNTWSATLSASYPLFDGFRTRAQVAQAQSASRTVEKQKTDLQLSIELEINQGTEDIQSLEQKIAIESVKITHAERALQIAEERFRNGVIPMTDMIDTQNALENARLNRLQLVFNHVLARYNLYRASGRKLIP